MNIPGAGEREACGGEQTLSAGEHLPSRLLMPTNRHIVPVWKAALKRLRRSKDQSMAHVTRGQSFRGKSGDVRGQHSRQDWRFGQYRLVADRSSFPLTLICRLCRRLYGSPFVCEPIVASWSIPWLVALCVTQNLSRTSKNVSGRDEKSILNAGRLDCCRQQQSDLHDEIGQDLGSGRAISPEYQRFPIALMLKDISSHLRATTAE
jgi:hypothetical protein